MASKGPTATRAPRVQAQFEAYAAVLKAAEDLQRGFIELLKTHDLSPSQYNVLRMLRGAGERGLACGEMSDRLIRHDPDITRLVDRLEKRSLVQRVRERTDRRVVRTSITTSGLALLGELDGPVDALHERQLGHLSAKQLLSLSRALQEATAHVT